MMMKGWNLNLEDSIENKSCPAALAAQAQIVAWYCRHMAVLFLK